ncbi:MAG TPA: isoaspartyl peptidase/L-asparaginase family protein [Thioalkalivibrio sp.]|nr:isoaspartyl peptidase/L-asparaginase family protein [Thioalkalivibrio sp.]
MAHTPVLMVHGGAGRYPEQDRDAAVAACEQAARRGWAVLREGGSALDAVQAAVMALEDNPLFNAGTGSVLNIQGRVEMDAAIMDGSRLAAGAVAAVSAVRNPVCLARALLEQGETVMRVGPAAESFAREQGIVGLEPDELITARQHRRWQEAHGDQDHVDHETVGCVALDALGRLATATSTGGLFNKPAGRVGDSALIGCGTYADERGAVSCTGQGEAIIRSALAMRALGALAPGVDPQQAARQALHWLAQRTGAEAGLILLDHEGRGAIIHNAPNMAHCRIEGQGEGQLSCGL